MATDKPIFTTDPGTPSQGTGGKQYEYLIEAERQRANAASLAIKGLGSFTLDAVKGYMEANVEKAATHAARNLVNPDANYVGEDIKQRSQEIGIASGAIQDLEKARDRDGEDPALINPQIEKFKEKISTIMSAGNTGALSPTEARLYVANEIRKWGAIMPGWLTDFRKVAANVTGVDNLDGVDIKTAFTLQKENEAAKKAAAQREWLVKLTFEKVMQDPTYAGNTAAALKEAERIVDSDTNVRHASLATTVMMAQTARSNAQFDNAVATSKLPLDQAVANYNANLQTDATGKFGKIPAARDMSVRVASIVNKYGLYNADGTVNIKALSNPQVLAEMASTKAAFLDNVTKTHNDSIAKLRTKAAGIPGGVLETQITTLENNFRTWLESNQRQLNNTDWWLDTAKMLAEADKRKAETRQNYLATAQSLASLSNSDFVTKMTGATTHEGFKQQYPWAGNLLDAINANVRAGTGQQFVVAIHKEAEKADPDINTEEGKNGALVKMGNGEVALKNGAAVYESGIIPDRNKADLLYYVERADFIRKPAELDKFLKGGDEKALTAHFGGDKELAKQVIETAKKRLAQSMRQNTTESQELRETLPAADNSVTDKIVRAVGSVFSLLPGVPDRKKDVPIVIPKADGTYEFSARNTDVRTGKERIVRVEPSAEAKEKAYAALNDLKARVNLYNKLNQGGTQLDFQTVLNTMLTPQGERVDSEAIPKAQRASSEAKLKNAEYQAKRLERDIEAFSKYPNDSVAAQRVKEKTEELAVLRQTMEHLSNSLTEGAE